MENNSNLPVKFEPEAIEVVVEEIHKERIPESERIEFKINPEIIEFFLTLLRKILLKR